MSSDAFATRTICIPTGAGWRAKLQQDFALRLLPALISLPIEIVDAAGSPQSLADIIRSGQHITLSGPSGGGRRLALQQWALQWAAGDLPGGPTPMILALARLDDGVSPPDRLLSAFIRAATPPTDPKPPRDMLQFFRRDAIPPEPDVACAQPSADLWMG